MAIFTGKIKRLANLKFIPDNILTGNLYFITEIEYNAIAEGTYKEHRFYDYDLHYEFIDIEQEIDENTIQFEFEDEWEFVESNIYTQSLGNIGKFEILELLPIIEEPEWEIQEESLITERSY